MPFYGGGTQITPDLSARNVTALSAVQAAVDLTYCSPTTSGYTAN